MPCVIGTIYKWKSKVKAGKLCFIFRISEGRTGEECRISGNKSNIEPFVFRPITVLYGNNGSGKSTLLNIIANCLQLKGKEDATSNSFGSVDYCGSFSRECLYTLGKMTMEIQ